MVKTNNYLLLIKILLKPFFKEGFFLNYRFNIKEYY